MYSNRNEDFCLNGGLCQQSEYVKLRERKYKK